MPEDFKAEELIFLLRRINLHLSTQLELSLKENAALDCRLILWCIS